MEKFIIDYKTGVTENVEVYDLNEAKEIALEGIAYTQEHVVIKNEDGEVLTQATWYGVEPEEDDHVLITVGEGFYQTWSDELE